MAFDDDIALTPDGDGTIADGWATPRGPHGGYVMEVAVGDAPMPAVAPPGDQAEHYAGAPPFTHRLSLQPRFGDPPFSASDSHEVGGWIDLSEPRALDGALIAQSRQLALLLAPDTSGREVR